LFLISAAIIFQGPSSSRIDLQMSTTQNYLYCAITLNRMYLLDKKSRRLGFVTYFRKENHKNEPTRQLSLIQVSFSQ